ncbi:MAG: ABC transporter substrate-binding protein [Thermomicrobiales bacterium]|nr:ABC transporter substrate-binding protein [Thermomicrobiales bacterium]
MNQLNTTWMTDATQHLFSRLVTRDPETGAYVPELATWEISEDGLTWTFQIREGVTFHNGDPLTSDAIAWWFEQARDPDGFYGFKGSFSAVETITAVDPQTVVVTLSHPDAAILFMLYTVYSSIHNPTTYEELGADAYGIEDVDGTGAFKLQEFTPGDKLVIVRNDAFNWPAEFVANQEAPYLDAVEYRYIADASARSAAIEAGDLDIVVGPNLADVERLSQNSNLTVVSKPQPACRVVNFNCEQAPFDNKLVRQAFAHAVQRDPIVERLLFGQGVSAHSLVPPIFPDMFLEETTGYFPYDIEQARALLAEAGLVDEDGDGFVEFEGNSWEPEMLVSTDTELVTLAQVMQAQAAEIGIRLSISQIDLESLSARESSGEFDLVTGFYLWDGPDTMYEWWFLSSNIGTTNAARLSDPAIDELIEEMRNTATLEDRYAVVKDLQAAIHGDLVPLVPIYHPLDIYVMSNRVRGYEPNAFTLYPRMNDTWLA